MLSNTADTKPRPKAVCEEAAGSFSTGIIEAQVTSASRNTVPLTAPGSSSHSGLRSGAVTRIAATTVTPRNGNLSASAA